MANQHYRFRQAAPDQNGLVIGLLPEMSDREYHSNPLPYPALTQSINKVLVSEDQTPAHAKHKMDGGWSEPTPQMEEGTVWHAIVQGRGHELDVIESGEVTNKNGDPVCDFKSDAAKERQQQARAQGKVAVFREKYDRIAEAARSVRHAIEAQYRLSFSEDCLFEKAFAWREEAANGVIVGCRCKTDIIVDPVDEWGLLRIIDLKFVECASPRVVANAIASFCYEGQGYSYSRAVSICADLNYTPQYTLACVEREDPHLVSFHELTPELYEDGAVQWHVGVNRFAQCLKSGRWPGYQEEGHFHQPQQPAWKRRWIEKLREELDGVEPQGSPLAHDEVQAGELGGFDF